MLRDSLLRRPGTLSLLVGLSALTAGCGGPGAPQAAAVGSLADSRVIDPPAVAGSLAPELTVAGGEVLLSWLEPLAEGRHRLRVARLASAGWSEPVTVAEGDRFFANWADRPAVVEAADGSLLAHWLAKTGDPVYAYSIFLARSTDGGASWAALGRLNDDDTPTEHGFVSWLPEGDGARAFWLDGRAMIEEGPMALRTARVDGAAVGASELLDPRVCDCCSTGAALGATGPVVVYRDRDAVEIRDISVVRRTAVGWSAPRALASDGWQIAGCPVNGPEIALAGQRAAAVWFTAAGDRPAVRLAFSADSGASFGEPLVVDGVAPLGRVDLVLDEEGAAVVSWIGTAGEGAALRLRRIAADGRMAAPLEVAAIGRERASGFPRLVRRAATLYLAWVDTAPVDGARIRVRAVPLGAVPAPPSAAAGET